MHSLSTVMLCSLLLYTELPRTHSRGARAISMRTLSEVYTFAQMILALKIHHTNAKASHRFNFVYEKFRFEIFQFDLIQFDYLKNFDSKDQFEQSTS